MTTHIEARDALVKRLRKEIDRPIAIYGKAAPVLSDVADELVRTCEWQQIKNPAQTGMWQTGCGHKHWEFSLSTPEAPFCPYCGGRISVKEAGRG